MFVNNACNFEIYENNTVAIIMKDFLAFSFLFYINARHNISLANCYSLKMRH